MKKIIWGLLFVLLLLFIGLLSIPFLFKGKIISLIKETANQELNATLDFSEVDISVFKSFPELYISIDSLTITGKEVFENLELINISRLGLGLDLWSVLGSEIKVREIDLIKPKIHVKVLQDGRANYDIAKSDSSSTSAEESSSSFSLKLKKYSIQDGLIIYDDQSMGFLAKIEHFKHEGTGDYTNDIVQLKTVSISDTLTIAYEGVPYLNKVFLKGDCNLELDLAKSIYTFKENEFLLNDLPIYFNGSIGLPNETDISMDFQFEAKKSEFKSVLSLIPAIYAKDFDKVKTAGKFALKGAVKGIYNDTKMPGFDIALKIEDAMFRYPDLPSSVENIQVNLKMTNPDGIEDHTVIDLQKMHLEMAGNPFDAKILTQTPVSDPKIDGFIKGKIDLSTVQQFMPVTPGESYQGVIESDITLKGNMSAIEKEQYDQFYAAGYLKMQQFIYQTTDMPRIAIEQAHFTFSPQALEVLTLNMLAGKSDFSIQGNAKNYLAYYLKDEPLQAIFSSQSRYIDANEWLPTDTVASSTNASSTSSESSEIVEVPKNIDFTFKGSVGELVYEDKHLKNVNGTFILANQEMRFEEMKASFLGGLLAMNGTYNTQIPNQAKVDFSMDIQKFDLPQTFNTFVTVQKLAPIIENSSGAYSMGFSFTSLLKPNMEPDLNSIQGKGKMLTHNILVKNSGVLGKLADQFKMDQFKQISLNNVNISFAIQDGKIELTPFDFMIGKATNVNVSGYSKVDQSLDFKMNVTVPTSEMQGAQALTGLLGGLAGAVPKAVNADVLITGTATDPKVKVSFKDFITDATATVKDMAKQELDKLKNQAEAKAKEELAKKEKEAREKAAAQAAKLIQEAEAKASTIKSEAQKAADKIRQEGENAAKKVEAEAKNPIAKIAAKEAANKIRQEANKKADNLVKEANQKADGLVNGAKAEAAKINP